MICLTSLLPITLLFLALLAPVSHTQEARVVLPPSQSQQDLEKAQAQLSSTLDQLSTAESDLAQCRDSVASFEAQVGDLKTKTDKCEIQGRELEESLKNAEASYQERLSALEERGASCQHTLEASLKEKEALIACESRVAKLDLGLGDCRSQREKSDSRLADLQIEKENIEKHLTTRLTEIEKALQEEQVRHEAEKRELKDSLSTLQQQYAQAEEQLARAAADTYVISVPRLRRTLDRVLTLNRAVFAHLYDAVLHALPPHVVEDGSLYLQQLNVASKTVYQVHLAPPLRRLSTSVEPKLSRGKTLFYAYAQPQLHKAGAVFQSRVLPTLVTAKNTLENLTVKAEALVGDKVLDPFIEQHPEVKDLLPPSPRLQIVSIIVTVGGLSLVTFWTLKTSLKIVGRRLFCRGRGGCAKAAKKGAPSAIDQAEEGSKGEKVKGSPTAAAEHKAGKRSRGDFVPASSKGSTKLKTEDNTTTTTSSPGNHGKK